MLKIFQILIHLISTSVLFASYLNPLIYVPYFYFAKRGFETIYPTLFF
jgi:hypothetical protein